MSFFDLKEEEFIIESSYFRIHHIFRKKCIDAGFQPNIIFQTSGFGLCHKLCQQKRGLSIVVDRISQDMTGTGMKKIPFEEDMIWQVEMICRQDFATNDMIKLFSKYTREYIKMNNI